MFFLSLLIPWILFPASSYDLTLVCEPSPSETLVRLLDTGPMVQLGPYFWSFFACLIFQVSLLQAWQLLDFLKKQIRNLI